MNKKLIIGGEEADRKFNLRTSETILSCLIDEAAEKNKSANLLLNEILLKRYSKINFKNQKQ